MEESNHFTDPIMEFLRVSQYKMQENGIRLEDIAVAIPSYAIRIVSDELGRFYSLNENERFKTVFGMKIQPTWEHAITVFYVHHAQLEITPIFRLELKVKSEVTQDNPRIVKTTVTIS